ncbi:MAG: haloacid dehalogenase [Thermomicrobiales bacterium]|nr:haloacid dehalogenase [Thermomicrobiales bacterium]
MHRTHPELAPIGREIIARFETVNASRDRALNEGRQIIRLAANTIRAIHRNELEEAADRLAEAESMLRELVAHLEPFPEIYWQGYVQDAMKEYGEARIVLAMVIGAPIPPPSDLGIEDAPWLNALAEAASELRRELLDALRLGATDRAESLLAVMDDAYDLLVTVDFPDGITGGLRRTTDQFRAVLERTRNDLTLTMTQDRLERALRQAEATFTRVP